jgi:hypothetical protein
MVMRAIKEFFSTPTVQIHVGSSEQIIISAADLSTFQFIPPEKNLLQAWENGIQPVNYNQLSQQFSDIQLANAILFDSAPYGTSNGNHWRIKNIDGEHTQITIQLCSSSGYYDEIMPAVTVSQNDILFTDINIMHYEKLGTSLSLTTIAETGTKARKDYTIQFVKNLHVSKETYFADAHGNLILKQDHPLFQKS